ncbi:GNAT family N-acetyltransferase [Maritimibacter fusiformis]|nr:GNAT family N-acetyltransferase [Maritimibacter fusiformis]
MTHVIQSVDQTNFADLARLIEARGGPHYCWCMAWRDKPPEVTRAKGTEGRALRRAAMQARVARGDHVGLLAYDGGTPVGWCSTGPLSTFARLGGPRDIDPAKTWAISCFFVPREHRGQGISHALTAGAIDTARAAGARLFQVTAVDAASPSYRFMGKVGLYESFGFRKVAMAGTRRHVMRLDL